MAAKTATAKKATATFTEDEKERDAGARQGGEGPVAPRSGGRSDRR
jgi:hypothetical protein